MLKLKKLTTRYLTDESGATAIEYGLIAALIGIAIMSGARAVSDSINNLFGNVDGDVQKSIS